MRWGVIGEWVRTLTNACQILGGSAPEDPAEIVLKIPQARASYCYKPESLTNRPKSLAREFLHFMQTTRYWTL